MQDYYRFKFGSIRRELGRRIFRRRRSHPEARLAADSRDAPQMPDGVRFLVSATWLLGIIGVTLGVVFSKTPFSSLPTWLAVLVLAGPASLALALVLENEWPIGRPLLVAALASVAAFAAARGAWPVALATAIPATCLCTYLYLSDLPSTYFAALRTHYGLRLTSNDLLSKEFVPLYTGAIGFTIGAAIALFVIPRLPNFYAPTGAGVYGAASIVGGVALLGCPLAYLGAWIGEQLAARSTRRGPTSGCS